LTKDGSKLYVLRAFAGQTMNVVVTAPGNAVGLSIWGADGTVLKRYVDETTEWHGELPSTQDYFIQLIWIQETSCTLTVSIPLLEPEPTRIQFEPGATSATVGGNLEPHGSKMYVLRALGGQTMDVEVISPGNNVGLSIWGADGQFLNWCLCALVVSGQIKSSKADAPPPIHHQKRIAPVAGGEALLSGYAALAQTWRD